MIKSSPYVLFIGCFIALITTSFGFILRIFLMDGWAKEFNFSQTQQGELFGVGLWPFAISIILFSLVIDKIGYKTAMIFGFICHTASVLMTISAHSYEQLYWANFVVALGNGTVEAYINPIVATQFSKDKVRWLNVLHAGWPAGLAIAGITVFLIGDHTTWQNKMWLLMIPAVAYLVILSFQKFPINERVAAGIPYMSMLKEVGALGAFIITWMIAVEISRSAFHADKPLVDGTIVAAVVAIGFFSLVRTLGRPLFILILLIMVPLATTELGVDSWVSSLMTPVMGKNAIWVLIYTSTVMMILRLCAGPIIHRISPLGTLAMASGVAAVGLFLLSGASTAFFIMAAATLYAMGKSFFWPTMLGVVSEQCPKGGALTLNATGGVGMLGVGVLGAMFMGNMQDRTIDSTLLERAPKIHESIMVEKSSLLGPYQAIDDSKLAIVSEEDKKVVASVQANSKQLALTRIAIFPASMFVFYILLILYFKSRGGYRPINVGAREEH